MAESEMVERVAEALWNAASVRAAGRPRLVEWTDESEKTRDDWRHGARAAIEAMREPTDGMLEAAATCYRPTGRRRTLGDILYVEYRAAINAALSPSPATEKRNG